MFGPTAHGTIVGLPAKAFSISLEFFGPIHISTNVADELGSIVTLKNSFAFSLMASIFSYSFLFNKKRGPKPPLSRPRTLRHQATDKHQPYRATHRPHRRW